MKKKFLHILAIPLISLLLFVFESSDPQYYGQELLWSFGMSFVLWNGNALIVRFLNAYIPWREPPAPRIFIQFCLILLLTYWLTYYGTKILYHQLYEVHFGSLIFRKHLFIFLLISFLYNALYTGSHFFNQWRQSIVDQEELKRQNLISQNHALKSQIDPHFLFNSLNTLVGLIDEDPEIAKAYGLQFAKIYRYILERSQEELLTLEDELGLVEAQQAVLQSRFGSNLQIKIDVPLGHRSKLIPPLALQMLLENAIKHNRIGKDSPLEVCFHSPTDKKLQVCNNRQHKSWATEGAQVGLKNITQRYQYLTKRPVRIEKSRDKFLVELPLLDKKEL